MTEESLFRSDKFKHGPPPSVLGEKAEPDYFDKPAVVKAA